MKSLNLSASKEQHRLPLVLAWPPPEEPAGKVCCEPETWEIGGANVQSDVRRDKIYKDDDLEERKHVVSFKS